MSISLLTFSVQTSSLCVVQISHEFLYHRSCEDTINIVEEILRGGLISGKFCEEECCAYQSQPKNVLQKNFL